MGIGAILRTRAIGKPLSLASPLLDDEVSTVAIQSPISVQRVDEMAV